LKELPLSLYIHWPWCLKKCPYCDFNSHGLRGPAPEALYEAAIIEGLKEQGARVQRRKLKSIFFGGGTPSLMAPETIGRIIEAADNNIPFHENIEITLEANPGTFEEQKFKDFREAGVNRLSIGIQSFDDAKLRALGRVHNSQEARRAAESAGKIFENFNLDLMFGLPGQTIQELDEELETAFSFGSTHLSCYQLTLEPNTYFAKFPPKGIPDDDVLSDMFDLVRDKTAARGFDHYEVSAYAKGGYRCRHNLNYWEFGDYFAVGPGAHGKITIQGRPERFYNYRDPARWLLSFKEHQTQIAERKLIDPEDLPFEFMLNALRLREGVPFDFYTERTGLDFDVIESIWTELREKGLVCDHLKRIKTTEKGWLFLNEVLEAFL